MSRTGKHLISQADIPNSLPGIVDPAPMRGVTLSAAEAR
jgi:hypothetical protein